MRLRLPDLKDPKKKASFILLVGAAIIAISFVMVIAIPVFSNPKFCNICHSNSADVASWEKSSHANVTCYSCHMPKGIPVLLYDKVYAGVTGVYYETTGNYELPINAESEYSVEYENELCGRCHNSKNRKITPKKGLNMNHEIHEENGVGCAICHNRVAHRAMNNQLAKRDPKNFVEYVAGERKEHKYLEGVSHEGCFRCHTRKESKLLEERPEWKAPTKCEVCHNKDWDLPAGHGEGFRASHGVLAKTKGTSYCLSSKCHNKEEFCGECHEVNSL